MRRIVYFGALVTMSALFSAPVSAQTRDAQLSREAWHVNAVAGQSFDSVGSAPAGLTSAGYDLGRGLSVVGEVGTFRIMPSIPVGATYDVDRVNSYHANANALYRLPELGRLGSYVTTGVGSFNTSTIVEGLAASMTTPTFQRDTHLAVNIGAGFSYRLTPWLGLGGDHRSFLVNVNRNETRRVHRFTAGVSLLIG